MSVTGTKLKMTQIFQGEKALGVTPVRLRSSENMAELKAGARVKVSGISKGKGFAGVVKRYGFRGGPKTHGQKNRLRAPGSIGNTSPQRVIPGRRMAGRMGGVTKTIRNLEIALIDESQQTIFLKGAVPGNTGGKVRIVS
jgi:large subunit ribosomal protein L3